MRIYRDNDNRRRSLPVIGKLKVGEKVRRGNTEFPQSLDYFRATGNYAGLFHRVYGDRPGTVQVVFPTDDTDVVCAECYEARNAAGLLTGRSDGRRFELWSTQKSEWVIVEDRDDERVRAAGKWRTVLTLRFVLPRLRQVVGLWQLTTHADKSTIPQVVATFDAIRDVVGSVVNIPFDLSVQKVQSQLGERRVFPVIQLVPNLSYYHLDMLRSYIDSGHSTRQLGIITEEKIETALCDIRSLPAADDTDNTIDIGVSENSSENSSKKT